MHYAAAIFVVVLLTLNLVEGYTREEGETRHRLRNRDRYRRPLERLASRSSFDYRIDCPPCDAAVLEVADPWTENPKVISSWNGDDETTKNNGSSSVSNQGALTLSTGGAEGRTNGSVFQQWFNSDDTSFPPDTEVSVAVAEAVPSKPKCTCMSVIQCGATFRSSLLEEELFCHIEGEVCCPTPAMDLPPVDLPSTATPVGRSLRCGQSSIYPQVQASVFPNELSAQFGEFPWTALIYSKDIDEENNGKGDFRCSGSLVHPSLVVTAAHCIVKQRVEALVVRLGDWDLLQDGVNEPLPSEERAVSSTVIHPSFRPGHPPYDIAVIFLYEPVVLTPNINPICIPTGYEDFDTTRCVSSGWGVDVAGLPQNLMKKVILPIVPRPECQQSLRKTMLGRYFQLHKSYLCAGGEQGQDVCTGDGGGPLSCPQSNGDHMLVGITSWGVGCGKGGVPGVYTDVIQLREWLLETMKTLVPIV